RGAARLFSESDRDRLRATGATQGTRRAASLSRCKGDVFPQPQCTVTFRNKAMKRARSLAEHYGINVCSAYAHADGSRYWNLVNCQGVWGRCLHILRSEPWSGPL